MAGRSGFFFAGIAVFFVVVVAWASTVPVEPADGVGPPGEPVQAGNITRLEITGWYSAAQDGEGYVFYTTQEERWPAGQDPPQAEVTPQRTTEPLRFEIPGNADADTGGLASALLGRRVNESFTTDRFAPDEPFGGFGDWQGEEAFDRHVGPQDVLRTLSEAQTPGFNLSEYLLFWERNGFADLEEGDTFPCDGPDRWLCRVAALDEGAGSITMERLVEDGAEYPLGAFFGGAASTPVDGSMVVLLDDGGDTFRLRMDVEQGVMFQLRQQVPGLLPQGTYRVTNVTDENITVLYTSNASVAPGLIDKWIWYDVVIVAVD